MRRIYEVDLWDSVTGAVSAIDTVEAPEGYTAEDYIRDCKANAGDEWVEMLEKWGKVSLIEVGVCYDN